MNTPLPSTCWKPIDWNLAPAWAKWAAQDASGRWFFYEEEPIAEDGYFTVARLESGTPSTRVDEFRHVPYPAHWRSSLTRRPEASTARVIPFPARSLSYAVLPA